MRTLILLLLSAGAAFGQLAPLSVEKIMRDPKWIGVAPTGVYWAEDSKQVYFNWNPEGNADDSLYFVSLTNRTPQKVAPAVRRALPSTDGIYNKARTRKAYEKNGDIFLLDLPSMKVTQITYTVERESNPIFSTDEKKILFNSASNLF